MTHRFAAFAAKKGGEARLSLELWKELYESSGNTMEKNTALRYIKQIKRQEVEKSIKLYHEEKGFNPADLSDLSQFMYGDSKPLESLFKAPDDDRLYYNKRTGELIWYKEKIKEQEKED
jgi:hypothetical protein